jgi:protein pelota
LATYGEEKVRKSIEAGAVDLMLITSSIDENKIEELAALVENQSGDWIILDKDGSAGKTLDGLGGIGAILRYKLQL